MTNELGASVNWWETLHCVVVLCVGHNSGQCSSLCSAVFSLHQLLLLISRWKWREEKSLCEEKGKKVFNVRCCVLLYWILLAEVLLFHFLILGRNVCRSCLFRFPFSIAMVSNTPTPKLRFLQLPNKRISNRVALHGLFAVLLLLSTPVFRSYSYKQLAFKDLGWFRPN